MQVLTPTLLQTTINPNQWTLADWLTLAELLEKPPMWGWYKYIDLCENKTDLKTLSLQQWEEIARVLETKDGWAYYRYKEYYENH